MSYLQKTATPDLGMLSPIEHAIVARGDCDIREAMLRRSVARIRCHEICRCQILRRLENESLPQRAERILRESFDLPPDPAYIEDLTSWD